ncbi:MAG: 50S ribosomal protein L9 [Acidobacteria bacterium]|nr:MAG: 50S ribosomal protein L9 [Acidobacteriota bacterium]PIE90343.1 MAG: 50S ribosomal protein L9 [Acidobacteriota bacterium]
MEVLLRETVEKLGDRGSVVKVADGYARNYLFPKRLAVRLTDGNMRQLEIEKRNYEKKVLSERSGAEEAKAKLEEMTFTVSKRAGESNQLFGSVTSQELSELLKDKGFEIDRRKLQLPQIKELGEYEVQAKLHQEVSATFKLVVVGQ